jgi:type II secretory pathway pseudopilin PulG
MRSRSWVGGLLVGLVLMGMLAVGFVAWIARERALQREMAMAERAEAAQRQVEWLAAKAQAGTVAPAPAGAAESTLERLRAENSTLRARIRELEAKPGVSGRGAAAPAYGGAGSPP